MLLEKLRTGAGVWRDRWRWRNNNWSTGVLKRQKFDQLICRKPQICHNLRFIEINRSIASGDRWLVNWFRHDQSELLKRSWRNCWKYFAIEKHAKIKLNLEKFTLLHERQLTFMYELTSTSHSVSSFQNSYKSQNNKRNRCASNYTKRNVIN